MPTAHYRSASATSRASHLSYTYPGVSPLFRLCRHFHFAHGGRADFRGRHGVYYSFFSAPNVACNVKIENATFKLRGGELVVDGSFITEATLQRPQHHRIVG